MSSDCCKLNLTSENCVFKVYLSTNNLLRVKNYCPNQSHPVPSRIREVFELQVSDLPLFWFRKIDPEELSYILGSPRPFDQFHLFLVEGRWSVEQGSTDVGGSLHSYLEGLSPGPFDY